MLGVFGSNMSTDLYAPILRASEEQKREHNHYSSELKRLSKFENSLTDEKAKFSQIYADYDKEKRTYSLNVKGSVYPMTQKTIADIMGKSGSSFIGSHKTFDEIKYIPYIEDLNASPIGHSYLHEFLERSKREVRGFSNAEHKVIFKEEDDKSRTVVGVKSPLFPVYDFKFSDFLPIFQETAEAEGKEVRKPRLLFNEESGNVKGMLLFDTFTLDNVSVNETVDYGIGFRNGKLGGSSFNMFLATNLRLCDNSLFMKDKDVLNILFKNTSSENYANHFNTFLKSTYGIPKEYMMNPRLTMNDKIAMQLLESQKNLDFMGEDYMKEVFYQVLSKSLIDQASNHMLQQKTMMETAGTETIDDFTKALERVWNFTPYGKHLSKTDKQKAFAIYDRDESINKRNPTMFDLSNVITRLANDYREDDSDKQTNLQHIGYQILANAKTSGIPAR